MPASYRVSGLSTALPIGPLSFRRPEQNIWQNLAIASVSDFSLIHSTGVFQDVSNLSLSQRHFPVQDAFILSFARDCTVSPQSLQSLAYLFYLFAHLARFPYS
jgi:hypothetical protein